MGKIVVIEHLSLDGVMQSPGHPDEDPRDGFRYGGWGSLRQDPMMQEVMGREMTSTWSLLAGRVTYQRFADYWPGQAPNPFTDALTRVTKYVASTTLTEPLAWENSVLLKGDVVEAVAQLKSDAQGNLVVFGSGVLVRSLLPCNLIDVFVLLVHPIVLGAGRRLFPECSAHTLPFQLVDSVTTGNGVIIATYRPEANALDIEHAAGAR